MVGEIVKAFQRKEHIISLADKIEEFYACFAPSDRNTLRTLPTYVLSFPSFRDPNHILPSVENYDFFENLVYEIANRTAPLNNFMYESKIVAESVYAEKEVGTPVYKLKVDVVRRPEGGHHC